MPVSYVVNREPPATRAEDGQYNDLALTFERSHVAELTAFHHFHKSEAIDTMKANHEMDGQL